MAKIKIREGSLEVELEGQGKLNDPAHPGGGPIKIEFETYDARYTFKKGVLMRSDGSAASIAGATSFEKPAGVLILIWAVAIAFFWFVASLESVFAGNGLADIPGGLAAVIAALTAGAGWNRYLLFRERTR